MPIAVRLLPFALAALAVAQVAPPSLGVVGRGGHGAVEIQGLPGSWIAAPALAEPAEAAASSPRQICWTSKGELHIRTTVVAQSLQLLDRRPEEPEDVEVPTDEPVE